MLLSHSELSKMCLTYLQLPPFKKPPFAAQLRYFGSSGFRISRYYEDELELSFGVYAAKHWSKHAARSERSIESETAILQTFASCAQRDTIERVRSDLSWPWPEGAEKAETLLQIIIKNRLTFIFTPASSSEPFQSRYGLFLDLPNSFKVWPNSF